MKLENIDNIKAIIFDYGATLDTQGIHWYNIFYSEEIKYFSYLSDSDLRQAYIYAERKVSKNRLIKEDFDFLQTLKLKVSLQVEYLVNNALIDSQVQAPIEDIVQSCYAIAKKNTQKSSTTLKKLKDKYTLALVSNFYGNLNAVLKDFGIKDYFDLVIESAKVGHSKPDNEIYNIAFRQLLLQPDQCAIVGDSYNKDIAVCKDLGCSTLWLKGKGWDDKQKIMSQKADCIVSTLAQIEDILI
jgi:haloacid dehalogenase superfamily, subfamily IA, variant 1 with third motif having Dx(3-4)D or Dx(3-4)E